MSLYPVVTHSANLWLRFLGNVKREVTILRCTTGKCVDSTNAVQSNHHNITITVSYAVTSKCFIDIFKVFLKSNLCLHTIPVLLHLEYRHSKVNF